MVKTILSFALIQGSAFDDLKVTATCIADYCFPHIIWAYWDGANLPKDIAEMIKVTKYSFAKETDLIYCFLDNKNLSDFLNSNLFPKSYFQLRPANKADYIRVLLLEKYGGVWVDCSMFINSGKEMVWFITQAVTHKSQMVAYRYHLPGHQIHFSLFGAPENSVFMTKFKDEYNYALEMGPNLYLKCACRRLAKEKSVVYNKYCRLYFMIDVVFANATAWDSWSNENVLKLPQNCGSMRLWIDCRYSFYCMHKFLRKDHHGTKYPFVKVFGAFRAWRDERRKGQKRKKNLRKTKQ